MPRFPNPSHNEDAFEEPIVEIERRLEELSAFPASHDTQAEIDRLKSRLAALRDEIYSNLSPWQKTLVARNQQRPYTLDYIRYLIEDFVELHGDRKFKEDPAIVSGFGLLGGVPVCVIGHQKGRDTKEKLHRNFGMPRPEGYRKSFRMMQMAEKFGRPIISFIDTPGAYPGIGAEERGQAEAIARSTEACLALGVPNVAVVLGEGGSGGAIAIATANRVLMLQHAIYSVISPEGAASILWRDTSKAQEAATSMKITADDLARFGVIDAIVPEPMGGAHRDPAAAIAATGDAIAAALGELAGLDRETVRRQRRDKFLAIGRSMV